MRTTIRPAPTSIVATLAVVLMIASLIGPPAAGAAADDHPVSDVFDQQETGGPTADDAVRNPVVQGPTSNGVRPNPWNASTFPLRTPDYDYREDEYIYSGTAEVIEDGTTAAYTSRFIIRQPADAADFNGVVLIDWMNVTNGQDWEYNWWPTAYDYAMRQGYAIVAVSAQSMGVRHLRNWDPVRYEPLVHPGDDFSYSIFAQAIEAVRDGANNLPSSGRVVDPLLGRTATHVIGGGVSQSAGRLIGFINRGYNRGRVDAWHIERSLGGTPADPDVLTFILNEETGFTGRPTGALPEDTDKLRVWEEAGIAHHAIEWWDYTYDGMQRDLGAPPVDPVDGACSVNRGTNGYSVRAMLHHTQAYFDHGILPPSAPRIPRLEDGSLPRDADGLVEGGLRHPFIEVPVALNRSSSTDCPNWGTHQPWDDAKIRDRYPTHAEYVELVAEAGAAQVAKGLLLREDCEDAITKAHAFRSPWGVGPVQPPPSCGPDGESAAVLADELVTNPAVTGPTVSGDRPNPWNASTFPLTTEDYDYREDEYIYSGTATYIAAGQQLPSPLGAPYASRFILRQPKDPADFNGIVLVDWMNVTNGEDWEYNWWPTAYDYLMREGYAIAGVSAQRNGVTHLREWDPTRYGDLLHPNDVFSYDIFSQAIEAIRDGRNNAPADGAIVDPMLGREVEYVIGGGVSQSASRLITFIDSGYNRGRVDAWNIERALGSTPSNLETFVFILNEETNYSGSPMPVQQADSDGLRVWEEAGVAHHAIEWYDYTIAGYARDMPEEADSFGAGCSVNRGTNGYSVRAMLHHTRTYLETGQLPPSAPRIPRNEDGSLPRDADTLVEGGLRHPFIEVPVAINRSTREDCTNWGTHIPFSDADIRSRYATHETYVCMTQAWADHQVGEGLLLAPDRDDAIAQATAFTAPWPDATGAPVDCAH